MRHRWITGKFRILSCIICLLIGTCFFTACGGKNAGGAQSADTDGSADADLSADADGSADTDLSADADGSADTDLSADADGSADTDLSADTNSSADDQASEGDQSAAGDQVSAEEGADNSRLEAVFFDVGKGDCILFSADGVHVLVDAGYEETSDEIITELQARGVDSLDAMIITHYDKDHVGGAAEIAEQIPVDMFYLPAYVGEEDKCGDLLALIEDGNLDHLQVTGRENIPLGGADLYVNAALVEYDEELENDNDASLLVEIFDGEDEWFLPGDIEEEAIDAWLAAESREYDILKVPHHGRKEGNTKEFLQAVSPRIAVITDSEEDEAAPKVLKRLKKEEAAVYRSSVDGTITITGNGQEEYEVTTQK